MVYDITYHDDETMQKVYNAMTDAGIDDKRAVDAVLRMGNAGILFRETSIGRTISFGGASSEAESDIKLYRTTKERMAEEAFLNPRNEYPQPPVNKPRLRFDSDENPFKKLKYEERQDDASLD